MLKKFIQILSIKTLKVIILKYNQALNEIEPKDLLLTASHLYGTCCFGSNYKNGVVDKNFKVFNYDNLFVVDQVYFLFLQI